MRPETILEDLAVLREQIQLALAGEVSGPVAVKSKEPDVQLLAQGVNDLLRRLLAVKASLLAEGRKATDGEGRLGAGTGVLRRIADFDAVGAELRDAVENRSVDVWYQPIVSAKVRNIVGFEALMRLRRRDGTVLRPADFMPVVETTDLMAPLTELLLEQSLTQLSQWQQSQQINPRCFMSVNLASRHILSGDLVEMIRRVLERTGVSPSLLKLEVTETVLIEQMDVAAEQLTKVREMGCSIAIDDFGTGYSSLLYLQRLPLDLLKLDRAFVREMVLERRPLAIARTICELAVVLGLDVIAEGVETIPQAELLESLGVKYLQGHWFKEPTEGVPLTEWLDSNEVHRFSRIIR